MKIRIRLAGADITNNLLILTKEIGENIACLGSPQATNFWWPTGKSPGVPVGHAAPAFAALKKCPKLKHSHPGNIQKRYIFAGGGGCSFCLGYLLSDEY